MVPSRLCDTTLEKRNNFAVVVILNCGRHYSATQLIAISTTNPEKQYSCQIYAASPQEYR